MQSPISSRNRGWRLILFIIVEMLLSAGLWYATLAAVHQRFANPFLDWRCLSVLAITFAQLLMLAVITAFWDFKRSVRWLLILAILAAAGLLFSAGFIVFLAPMQIDRGVPLWFAEILGLLGATAFAVVVTIGVTAVLLLHILLWAIRSFLGWQVHWNDEAPPAVKPHFTLWHLFVWVTLIAALLSVARALTANRTSAEITTSLLLWGVAALLAGFPALILATRRSRLLVSSVALIGWLVLMSLGESELTFRIAKLYGSGVWIPSWLLGICNTAVAATVILHVLLLRWFGMAFRFRLPFGESPPAREVPQSRPV
jgi:hypothetical protein